MPLRITGSLGKRRRSTYYPNARYPRAYVPRKRVVTSTTVRNYPSARRRPLNYSSNGLLGLEVKYHDIVYALTLGTVMGNANVGPLIGQQGTYTGNALNLVAQGNGPSNRDGRKCTTLSIDIQWLIRSRNAFDTGIRMILVQDRQTNGTVVQPTQVYDINEQFQTNQTIGPLNLATSKRFKILHDSYHILKPNNAVDPAIGDGPAMDDNQNTLCLKHGRIYKRLKVVTNYQDDGNTVEDVMDNSIYLFAIATEGINILTYTSRTRFVG